MKTLIFVLMLLGLCLGQGTDKPPKDCPDKACGQNQYCVTLSESSYYCIDQGYRVGNCSLHEKVTCHEEASCIQKPDHISFRCECKNSEAQGDGIKKSKQGSGCELPYKKCGRDSDCPQYGYCDLKELKCVCKPGYEGNGFNCTDIEECVIPGICDPNADCQDAAGSYTCTCDVQRNYKGDGKSCKLSCNNDNDCDAPRAICNDDLECECKTGFKGNGELCEDINECLNPADNDCPFGSHCINKQGGFICECSNGFFGDGKKCEALPKNCDDINKPTPRKIYRIDPDGTGPADSFEVECDKIKGVIVTKIYPFSKLPLDAGHDEDDIKVTYEPKPKDLQPFVKNAKACYQDMIFQCYKSFGLFPGTKWQDVFGDFHENWGTDKKHHCACGATKKCEGGCACNGLQGAWLTPEKARFVDKDHLPLVAMTFNAPGKRKGKLEVGPLVCAQKPFGIPKDCHDAKFNYGVKKNEPIYIDVDGEGPVKPMLVFCDVESYKHVGITEVPAVTNSYVPNTSDENTVEYTIPGKSVEALIVGSLFCSQKVEILCHNSPVLGQDGAYVTGPKGKLNYFPGANGEPGKCGCGATLSCSNPTFECNCNIPNAGLQRDFGVIIDKSDLPVLNVRAKIGPGRARMNVGALRCSQLQFAIEPNCNKYRTVGVTTDYTYFIDPDGPGKLDPFLVECKFQDDPPLGLTILHHDKEDKQKFGLENLDIRYLKVSPDQIKALKKRSTFCTQKSKSHCNKLQIQVEDNIEFTAVGNSSSFALAEYLSTCKDGTCKCVGGAVTYDEGTLTDMDVVPIGVVDYSNIQDQINAGKGGELELGPLICSEIFESCEHLQSFINSDGAVLGEGEVLNGVYTIDADGVGGVPPFSVKCRFPSTLVDITGGTGGVKPTPNEEEPIDRCFKVNYRSSTGRILTPEQINALAARSGKCRQELSLECQNAPASGNANFTTCDGKEQKGWAGSYGADSCACGVSAICAGGRDAKCNCDMNDNTKRTDKATIIAPGRVPICEICLRVAPKKGTPDNPSPVSQLKYRVGQLRCDGNPGTKPDCQNTRKGNRMQFGNAESKTVPTTLSFNGKHVPVACKLYRNPQVGVLEIRPREPVNPPEEEKEVDVTITYIIRYIQLIRETINRHEYCRQKVFLYCLGDKIPAFGGDKGFFGLDGKLNSDWVTLDDDSEDVQTACDQNKDLCDKCGRPKGYLLTNKATLPVATIYLPYKGVTVVVDTLECFNLKRSCQHMLDDNNVWFGYVGYGRYAIDPDGPLSGFPFLVGCQFNRKKRNGVTIVYPGGDFKGRVLVKDKNGPAKFTVPIKYKDASQKQIKGLTDISEFCWQGMKFECKQSPLLKDGNSYYSYAGKTTPAPSFGTGARVNFPGCACGLLGTCKNSETCNCDAKEPMGRVDQGSLSDKEHLPLSSFTVGGQDDPKSQATLSVTSLRCSRKRIEPPRDCDHAQKLGQAYGINYRVTGEYLISPNPNNVVPFMIKCDFETFPGIAVSVVKPTKEPREPHPDPKKPVEVDYYGPNDKQIRALIVQSKYCYQGVKIECLSTKFLGTGTYWETLGTDQNNFYWGGGEPKGSRSGVCACGKDGVCGGKDSLSGQRNRKCNCDVGDNTYRADAGILSRKEFLPIDKLTFVSSASEQNVNITVGDLFCADEPLDFNECEMGFSDCHPLADCVDEKVGYRCVCKPGWQGKTNVIDKQAARANGRECIDDDECSWNPCPHTATCLNLPGTFNCTCKPGFRQTGPLQCEDINECTEEDLNKCPENARCENLIGSYRCRCKRGFREVGDKCVPIGQCSCFGDPHCLSFDQRWLHFQGMCEYVMAQDNCGKDEFPNFMVVVKHWKRGSNKPGYFSWIKNVKVTVDNFVVLMEQKGDIYVDGIKTNQFVSLSGLIVTKVKNSVTLTSPSGLEVRWNGHDAVDLVLPTKYKGELCGLCGNYNEKPEDDWTVGPVCKNHTGTVTDNFELFGQSWTNIYGQSCDVDCNPEKPVYPRPCGNQMLVERECFKIFDLKTSPFKTCLASLPEAEIQSLEVSCEYDLCSENIDFRKAVCAQAEYLAEHCKSRINFVVTGWRRHIEACGKYECENNMVYKMCGPSNPNTCLNKNAAESPSTSVCIEGCFCAKGYMIDVDRCVKEEECGCLYEMRYLQKGEVIYDTQCQYKIRCDGNGQISKTPVSCGANQECVLQDGVVGCFCRHGYVMSEDGTKCVPDLCRNVDCTKIPNQECFKGKCQCKMGYVGNCQQCVNIDECATGLAMCNRIGHKCTDLDGSFSCDCEDGFVISETGCTDVDECAVYSDTCGDNAQCSNTLGGYECECCSGFKKNNKGKCVRDNGVPKSGKCCACQGDKCKEPGKVCGTDGITYKNYRTLAVASCRDPKLKGLKVNYKGKCQSSCTTVVCNKQFAECKVVDGVPQCGCPTCEDSSFSSVEETVCATNKITYKSVCHMKEATCEAEIETEVEVETFGKPCGGGEGIPVGPWGAWGGCSSKCAQGVKNRTRSAPPKSGVSDTQTVPCYSTCTEGPCRQDTCKKPGQVCQVDGNNVPSCTCLDCTDYPEDLICGRVGNVIETFDNECALKAHACKKKQKDFEVLEPRACEDKPTNCSQVRMYTIDKDANGCEADHSLNVGACMGGCDKTGELCCYPSETYERMVIMRCPNKTFYRKMIKTITQCDCLTTAQVNELKSGIRFLS